MADIALAPEKSSEARRPDGLQEEAEEKPNALSPVSVRYRYRPANVTRPKGGLTGVSGFEFGAESEAHLASFQRHFLDSVDAEEAQSAAPAQIITVPEFLLADYACTFKDELTTHPGRLYLSNARICFFHSLNFGNDASHSFSLRYDEMQTIDKKETSLLFPGAIEISCRNGKTLFFSAFLTRDKAFASLLHLLQNYEQVSELYIRGGLVSASSSPAFSDDRDAPASVNVRNNSSEPLVNLQGLRRGRPKTHMHKSGAASDTECEECDHDVHGMPRSRTFALPEGNGVEMELKKRRQEGVRKAERVPSRAGSRGRGALATTGPALSEHCEHMDRHDPVHDKQSEDFTFHTEYSMPAFSVLLFWRVFLETEDFWAKFVHEQLEITETTATKWAPHSDACCWEKTMDFLAPVKSRVGPLKPGPTHVHSTLRARLIPAPDGADSDPVGGLVLDAVSLTKDVPYGDTFALINRFEVHPKEKERGGIVVKMASRVKWLKSRPWVSSIIMKSCLNGGEEFCQQWRVLSFDYAKANKTRVERIESELDNGKSVAEGESSEDESPAAPSARPAVTNAPVAQPTVTERLSVLQVGGAMPKLQLGALVFICCALTYLVLATFYVPQLAVSSPEGAHVSRLSADIAALRHDMAIMRDSIEEINSIAMAFAQHSGIDIASFEGGAAAVRTRTVLKSPELG